MSISEIHVYQDQGIQQRQVFGRFKIKLFCFVVAMCDLVHDVNTMYGLC